jgi:hypothetical protein
MKQGDMHVEKNTEGKPPYSYAMLIRYAIENSPNKKLTLSEIYAWVTEHYPFYNTAGNGWKVRGTQGEEALYFLLLFFFG